MAGTQVDSSIYSGLSQPQPLELMSKLVNIQNNQNTNLAFQQQYKARMAMGHIMQKSVGEDGQPDYTKAATLAAQDPDAAWMAPDLMNKAVTMQGVSLDNVNKAFDNAGKRLKIYGDAAASLVPKGMSMTRADFAGAITNAATSLGEAGLHDKSTTDGLLSVLANAPAGGQGLYNYVMQLANQSNGAKDTLDRTKLTFQTVDSGDATHMYGYNPQFNKMTYIGSIPKKPTPEQLNDLVDQQDPLTGQTHKVPRYLAAPMAQGGGATISMPDNGQPASSAPAGPQVQGEAPQAVSPQPSAQSPAGLGPAPVAPPGPQAGAQPDFPMSKIGPLREEQLKNMGAYQDDLNKQVSTINQNIQSIQQLQGLAGKVHTGMFADERLEGGRLLKALGVPASVYNAVANGNLAASQQITKYAVPNAMNTLRNSLGNQSRITNMEFGSFQRANPNLESDPEAFRKILDFSHRMMYLKQQEQKAYALWQHHGQDPVEFPEAWTNQLVKRGFVHPDDMYHPYDTPKEEAPR